MSVRHCIHHNRRFLSCKLNVLKCTSLQFVELYLGYDLILIQRISPFTVWRHFISTSSSGSTSFTHQLFQQHVSAPSSSFAFQLISAGFSVVFSIASAISFSFQLPMYFSFHHSQQLVTALTCNFFRKCEQSSCN